jgi:peptidoglycan/LPS O-acetylase OafA/YrhL
MAPVWRYLSFTQNFGLHYGETFTHSWSLCIEEQFYLLLPLAVLALVGSRRSPWLLWGAMVAAIAAGMTMRGMAFTNGQEAFAAPVYYATWARFDELLPGVAIAMLKNFHPALFGRIQRHANALLVAGLAAAVAVLYGVLNEAPTVFLANTFGFSLVAMSFALLTCAALSPSCLLNRFRIPGAASLALWSYAVYLVHKPVFMALRPELVKHGIDPGAPLTIVAVMALGIFGGWLLYRLVETPFMRLRARWYPAGASSLALWSYAVYLVHKPVFMALRPEIARRGIDPAAPLTILAVMALGIFGGWLLYRLVETPFMRLRARWYPAGASAAPALPVPLAASR